MMRPVLVIALVTVCVSAPPASATVESDRARARIESVSREAVAATTPQSDVALMQAEPSLLQDRLQRIGHGAWSLLIPGWSQYRAGHTTRAIAFASVEAVVWGSWIFSEFQGRYREDQYEEFAGIFAGVDSGRDDDDYWRSVGVYVDSEQYNEQIRRENRAAAEEQELNGEPVTVGLNDGTIPESDSWEWTSERRRREYLQRRSDAISAYDRADFVLLFALLNRVVAFADAVRSAPVGAPEPQGLIESRGFSVDVDFDPGPADPSATLRLGRSF